MAELPKCHSMAAVHAIRLCHPAWLPATVHSYAITLMATCCLLRGSISTAAPFHPKDARHVTSPNQDPLVCPTCGSTQLALLPSMRCTLCGGLGSSLSIAPAGIRKQWAGVPVQRAQQAADSQTGGRACQAHVRNHT